MSLEVREELCASLMSKMRGGNVKVNSAESSRQGPDSGAEDVAGTEPPSDGLVGWWVNYPVVQGQ